MDDGGLSVGDIPTLAAAALERLRVHFGAADLAIIETMERVKARFLTTERDKQLAKQFQWLLRSLVLRADPNRPYGPDNRREARTLVVVGNSGAGKTAL